MKYLVLVVLAFSALLGGCHNDDVNVSVTCNAPEHLVQLFEEGDTKVFMVVVENLRVYIKKSKSGEVKIYKVDRND